LRIKLEMLRNFVTVARVGELAKAAHLLSRTPSAISMSLKQLQSEIPMPLFETDRKTKLTRIGEIILAEAEKAVRNYDQSLIAIHQHAKSESGYIRIAAVPSFASTILPPAIRLFSDKLPGVRLDIRDMDSRSIVSELLEDRIDIGVATSGSARYGILGEILWEDSFEAFVAHGHPLADRQTISVDDLDNNVFISNSLCQTINEPSIRRLVAGSSLSVHNTASLLSMVREGLGITILPRTVGTQSTGGISQIPIPELGAVRRLDILTLADKPPTSALSAFIFALRTAARTLRENAVDGAI